MFRLVLFPTLVCVFVTVAYFSLASAMGHSVAKRQAQLSRQSKRELSAITKKLFYPPLEYNNRKYLISNFQHKDVDDANTYCEAFGGYLAEIDDADELRALQSFVLNAIPDKIVIGGSDAENEGTWIFPRTGLPIPTEALDWMPGMPDDATHEDCLNLWRSFNGKMNDLPCGFKDPNDRFMCEIPN